MTLLAYNSCTGGYIVIFIYVFKIYPSWIYPLHRSSSLPYPLLRAISFFYFHVRIQNTFTIYTLIPAFLVPIPKF
jgi:hypothetical protein